jgi:hypothetical protein
VAALFALRLRNEERLGGVATSPSHLGGSGMTPIVVDRESHVVESVVPSVHLRIQGWTAGRRVREAIVGFGRSVDGVLPPEPPSCTLTWS